MLKQVKETKEDQKNSAKIKQVTNKLTYKKHPTPC